MEQMTITLDETSYLTWNNAETLRVTNEEGVVFPIAPNAAGGGTATLPAGVYTLVYKVIAGKEFAVTDSPVITSKPIEVSVTPVVDAIEAQTEALDASQQEDCDKLKAAIEAQTEALNDGQQDSFDELKAAIEAQTTALDASQQEDSDKLEAAIEAQTTALDASQQEDCDKLKLAIENSAEEQIEAVQMASQEEVQAADINTSLIRGTIDQHSTNMAVSIIEQTGAIVQAIEEADATDDDVSTCCTMQPTHCLDGKTVHTIVKMTSNVDPDGVQVEAVAIVGYLYDGGYTETLPAGATEGECPCLFEDDMEDVPGSKTVGVRGQLVQAVLVYTGTGTPPKGLKAQVRGSLVPYPFNTGVQTAPMYLNTSHADLKWVVSIRSKL